MSLASIKAKQEQCLNDIYASLEEQGAVIPDKKNLVNVASAIESIEGGAIGPTFIDYIESTGTQYIDTGFKHNQNTRAVLDFEINTHQNWKSIAGSHGHSSYSSGLFFIGMDDTGSFYAGYGTNMNDDITNSSTGRHVLDFNKNVLKIDDTSYTFTYQTFQSIYNFLIFGVTGYDGEFGGGCSCRVYSCQIYDNGVLVRNFKPCIDPNGVYCLYELVEGKYYHNQGTGEFIGDGWEPTFIDYIESTGTQYIDTGVNADYKLSIKADMQFLDVSTTTMSGTISSKTGTNHRHQFMYYNSAITYWYGTEEEHVKLLTSNLTDRYNFDIDIYNKKMRIGDGSYTNITRSDFNTQSNYVVFARSVDGTINNYSKIRLHSLQLYYGDTLVRDFVPALDENNVAGLWDKVNNVFYHNQGSGAFNAGPVAA